MMTLTSKEAGSTLIPLPSVPRNSTDTSTVILFRVSAISCIVHYRTLLHVRHFELADASLVPLGDTSRPVAIFRLSQ
jgi:hypothetical protein